jgi:hypothetical protein
MPTTEVSKSKRRNKSSNPFGEPDGQRSELAEDFVPFDGSSGWGDIATGDCDFEARLLIGRKGSGKTLYMRRLRACASKADSQYADDIDHRPPDTETILSFSRLFSEGESQLEWWSKLWDRCVLRSLSSHLLVGVPSAQADKNLTEKLIHFTNSAYGKLIREFITPVSAYRQMEEIVSEHHSRNSIVAFLQNPYWSDLEGVLAKALRSCPPIYLFLDALDEHFERSPRWWLKCQEGLFYYTIQSLRSNALNRLHLIVSLRDIVHASMMRSEHRSRFTGDSHIRMLNWHWYSIEEFLNVKLDRLGKHYFVNPTKGSRTIGNWLGSFAINNVKRGIAEPALQYLLRHTRLLPRDIIIIGNKICDAIERREIADIDLQQEIRSEIHEAASMFGREQFKICANEILSTYMPRCAHQSCNNAYVGNDEYASTVAEELQDVVREIGKDRFSSAELDAVRDAADQRFDCDLFSLFWRNGLIGCVDGRHTSERFIFYNHDSLNSFQLPNNPQEYVFHPIVIDATGIAAVGQTPVVPYAEGSRKLHG